MAQGETVSTLKQEKNLLISEVKRLHEESERVKSLFDEKAQKLESSRAALLNLLADIKRTERKLEERLKYERVLSDISAKAISEKNISKFENYVLKELGKSLSLSRCYIFKLTSDGKHFSRTSGWVSKGTKGFFTPNENSPTQFYRKSPVDVLWKDKLFVCDDVSKIKNKTFKSRLQNDVKSMLIAPVLEKNIPRLFIGATQCDRTRNWSETEKTFLRTVGDLIWSYTLARMSGVELEKQFNFQNSLTKISSLALIEHNLDGFLSKTLKVVANALGAEQALLFSYDAGVKNVAMESVWVSPKRKLPKLDEKTLLKIRKIAFDDIVKGKAVCISDFSNEPLKIRKLAKQLGLKSLLACPFSYKKPRLGILGFQNFSKNYFWGEPELSFVKTVTGIIAKEIEITFAQKEIAKSEEKYRSLVERSPDAIFSLDLKGRFTSVNKAVELLLGRPRKELLGDVALSTKYIAPESLALVVSNFKARLKNKKVAPYAIKILNKDGSVKIIEIHASPLILNGKIVGSQIVAPEITEKKHAEDALLKSEERLRAIFESSPEAIVAADFEGRVLSWNKSAEQLTGYRRKEVIGSNFLKFGFFDKNSLKKVKKRLDDIRKGKSKVTRTIYPAYRKDGSKFMGEFVTSPLIEGGKTIGLQSFVRDVTEKFEIENAINESEARYRSLIETAYDSIISVDFKGNIMSWNKAAEKFSGIKRETVLGEPFSSLSIISSKTKLLLKKKMAGALRGKVPSPFKIDLIGARGKKLIVELAMTLLKSENKINGIQFVVRDITERVESEKKLEIYRKHLENLVEDRTQELQLERDKLNSIVENMGESFLLLDAYGKITFCNNKAKTTFGSITGKYFNTLYSSAPDSESWKAILSSRKQGKSKSFEIVARNNKTYLATFTSSSDSVMVLLADITEIRDAQRSLAKSIEVRQKLGIMKDEFISMVSHELRTPLFPIKGYVETLMSGELGELTDTQKEALNVVHRNTKRLLLLVEDVLSISKLESKKMKFYFKDVDLDELLNGIYEEAKGRFATSKIKFSYEGRKVPIVTGDPDRIAEVVHNYITNAAKFTKKGSITIKLLRFKNQLEVRVIDTGIGIKAEHIKNLFQKFYQAEAPPSGEKGTGLGLAISRQIIEQHGGKTFVESVYGKGSTFGFRIPIKRT